MPAIPEVRFVRSGEEWIAFATRGEGPLDIVFVSPLLSNIDVMTEPPELDQIWSRFATVGRVCWFDRRGAGLSDPVPGIGTWSLDDWTQDLLTVLDAIDAKDVCLFTFDTGAPYTLLFAAAHPERVRAIALVEPMVTSQPGFTSAQQADFLAERCERHWGEGILLRLASPKLATDAAAAAWWARFERTSMARSAAVEAVRAMTLLDARPAVPLVQAPTLVLGRSYFGTPWLSEHLPNVKTIEVDHPDLQWWWDDELRADMLEEVTTHFTGEPFVPDTTRTLAAVLFTDLVASTEQAAAMGDSRWRQVLESHDAIAAREIASHGGSLIKSTGDGVLAIFDAPGRSIRCATAIRDRLQAINLSARFGIHTGEIEHLSSNDIAGISVHIAARIMNVAGSGEILVSRTVRDLVAGTGLTFVDAGEHALKGIPDRWQLLRVSEPTDNHQIDRSHPPSPAP